MERLNDFLAFALDLKRFPVIEPVPLSPKQVLRRHGDEMERLPGGYYRAHGRVDDTMNLGGIKVSSVEIERVCNAADAGVLETAAIGVPPQGMFFYLASPS